MKIIICTIKSWNIKNANEFKNIYVNKHEVMIISQKEDLDYEKVIDYNPDFIFFPHWSYIIPKQIFENFTCVVFHMTDLPFGRGGSPLQNLIAMGIYKTKISALKVTEGIDEGPIFLKKEFDISNGNASEVFNRASKIIFEEMIPYILDNSPVPSLQEGIPIVFKRRKLSDGEIKSNFSLSMMYDYIRMLDAEGYPNAFITFGRYRLSFRESEFNGNKLTATVEITEKESNSNE